MKNKFLAQIINPLIKDRDYTPGNDPQGTAFISDLISTIIELLLFIAAIVFIFQFLMGAIQWITSEGDKTKLEKARSQIQNSLTGLFIAFIVFVVLFLIGHFFGIESLKTFTLQWPTI